MTAGRRQSHNLVIISMTSIYKKSLSPQGARGFYLRGATLLSQLKLKAEDNRPSLFQILRDIVYIPQDPEPLTVLLPSKPNQVPLPFQPAAPRSILVSRKYRFSAYPTL